MDIDTNVPHTGRIYDFVLGGHHNFEADRDAAKRILEVLPAYPRWARVNRWFLQFVASKWAEDGHERVVDLGSGLPTQGHFHDAMPDAKVLYTDLDPIAVVYGQQILEGQPNRAYVRVDLRDPEGLIRECKSFFGERPKMAVGVIGVAYFLSDDEVRRLARALHDWCAPGSVLAISSINECTELTPEESEQWSEFLARYKASTGIQLTLRSPEHVASLFAPWNVEASRPLAEWSGAEDMFDATHWQETKIGMIGALFSHEPHQPHEPHEPREPREPHEGTK